MLLILLALAVLIVLTALSGVAARSRHVPGHVLYQQLRAAHEIRSIEAQTIREMLKVALASPGEVIDGTSEDLSDS